MLNTKTIRDRLHQTPFTPFRICLSDGRRISVNIRISLPSVAASYSSPIDKITFNDLIPCISLRSVTSGQRNETEDTEKLLISK